ncbi:DUF4760 domain-containing protein [Acidisoma cladoniae]|jgi:hypothetical protein|uniref:DUF4760 domain-containing protein n=1 Tax=Acidisoma cladoniae TaxID=3040935 RepID=UPI0025508F30|nr:hypothetical protein [Acidisoma sp. PAMC 29798]
MSIALFKYLDKPHLYLDNLRNIATVLGSLLIPVAISVSSRSRERKRATLDLLRRFTSDKIITDRLRSLYQYRRFEEAEAGAINPFASDSELIIESILMLNFCDTVCIEVKAGLIDRRMLYRTLGPTLIGARQTIMTRLETKFGMKLGQAYEDLERLVGQAETYQRRKGLGFVTRIPRSMRPSSPT